MGLDWGLAAYLFRIYKTVIDSIWFGSLGSISLCNGLRACQHSRYKSCTRHTICLLFAKKKKKEKKSEFARNRKKREHISLFLMYSLVMIYSASACLLPSHRYVSSVTDMHFATSQLHSLCCCAFLRSVCPPLSLYIPIPLSLPLSIHLVCIILCMKTMKWFYRVQRISS